MPNKTKSILKVIQALPVALMNILISFYQNWISPFLGQNCRHYPSCSHYTKDSLNKHGVVKGSILSTARIIRCNPWSLGGYDPVPETVSFKKPASFKLQGNYQTQLYPFKDL